MEKGSTNRTTGIVKIAVTGPESTGKSTLAEQLAGKYKTIWVPEFARDYLTRQNGTYSEYDLLNIATGQLEAEKKSMEIANGLLFCDTELLVIKIWSLVKYGRCHPFILQQIDKQSYAHYLLCDIDIPWTDDPLREHPDFREELFQMYESELISYGFPYTIIQGNSEERILKAAQIIDSLTDSRFET